MFQKRRAFTIIELIIAVSIIGILAVAGYYSYGRERQAGRDAYRMATIRSYATSLEQYYASQRSYMVIPSGCASANNTTTKYEGNANFNLPIYSPLTACVGFHGGGWGSLHRKNMVNYGANSIADTLRDMGFQTTLGTDPRTNGNFPADSADVYKTSSAARLQFNDFSLVLCTLDGKPAQSASEATAYSLYATLERQTDSGDHMVSVSSKYDCGKAGSPNTWEILE